MTTPDFKDAELRGNLRSTMDALIKMNCIPIINTNDAVAPPPGEDHDLKGVGTLLNQLNFLLINLTIKLITDHMLTFDPKQLRNNSDVVSIEL